MIHFPWLVKVLLAKSGLSHRAKLARIFRSSMIVVNVPSLYTSFDTENHMYVSFILWKIAVAIHRSISLARTARVLVSRGRSKKQAEIVLDYIVTGNLPGSKRQWRISRTPKKKLKKGSFSVKEKVLVGISLVSKTGYRGSWVFANSSTFFPFFKGLQFFSV